MGNATGKRHSTKQADSELNSSALGEQAEEVLMEAGWHSPDALAAFGQLLEHWRVAEEELVEVEGAPPLPKGLRVVEWRGDTLVFKRLPSSSTLHRELAVWLRLRPHRRVVGFRGVVLEASAVLTDYMPLGSMEGYILSQSTEPLTGSIGWIRRGLSLLHDVALGISHLHAEGFVWRDCAARNILLCKEDGDDQRLRAKITDFGFARRVDAEGRYVVSRQNHNLPVRVTAPESLATENAEYSAKSDCWAFGVLIYSMFALKRPYGDIPNREVIRGVREASLALSADDLFPSYQRSQSGEEDESNNQKEVENSIRALLGDCLQPRPADRPTFAHVSSVLARLLVLLDMECK